MDQNRQQGGDPNRRGAYYNPGKRPDVPSSSRCPMPADGDISGNRLAPVACPMPPGPSNHDSNSMETRPPRQNVVGRQHQNQRHPGSAAVFPASGFVYPPPPGRAGLFFAQQPGGSGIVFNAPGRYDDSNPNTSVVSQPRASLYAQPGPGPGNATDFSARGGNANGANRSTSAAGRIPPPPNANQGASSSHGPVAAAVPNRLLEAYALESEAMRWTVPSELQAIIDRLIRDQRQNGVLLMEVAEPRSGEIGLMYLAKWAAHLLDPEALPRLFRCLVDGWIMEQRNGPYLLRHFFTTLDSVHCSIFIEKLALGRFWEMVKSDVGHMSMMACLENSGDTEKGAILRSTIVTRTVEIANNMSGVRLLETILLHTGRGLNDLIDRIVERVEGSVIELSMNPCGQNVVLACFVHPRTPSALRRGLGAFLRLHDGVLRELVQNHNARGVLRLLLAIAYCAVTSGAAMQLAERILRVGARNAELHRPAGDDRREQAIAFLKNP